MLLIGFVALILVGWWEDKNALNHVIARKGAVIICFIAAISAHFLQTGYGFGGVVMIVLFYVYLQRADSFNFCCCQSLLTGNRRDCLSRN
jgi:hypothetical protein